MKSHSRKNLRRSGRVLSRGHRPWVESLELRRLLSTVDWISTSSGDWNNPSKWSTGLVPGPSDDVVIDVSGASPTVTIDSGNQSVNSLTTDDPLVLSGGSLTVAAQSTIGGSFTLSGGTLNVGGPITLAGASEWSDGGLALQGNTLTNTGTITIDATTDVPISNTVPNGQGGTLLNEGTIVQTNAGAPSLVSGVEIDNAASGIYEFETDSGIDRNTNFGPSAGLVVNTGLMEKTAGTGTSAIIVNFDNQGGTVAAETGTLSLAGGGTDTGGAFNASAGATVDLCDGSQTTSLTGSYTGTGSGTVNIGNGTVAIGASGATFDFAPGLFHWSSGGLALQGNTLTNTGTITIDATSDVPISNTVPNGQGGTLVNDGTIVQTNAGAPSLVSGVEIDNAASGVYEFETDSGIDRNTNFGPRRAWLSTQV